MEQWRNERREMLSASFYEECVRGSNITHKEHHSVIFIRRARAVIWMLGQRLFHLRRGKERRKLGPLCSIKIMEEQFLPPSPPFSSRYFLSLSSPFRKYFFESKRKSFCCNFCAGKDYQCRFFGCPNWQPFNGRRRKNGPTWIATKKMLKIGQ